MGISFAEGALIVVVPRVSTLGFYFCPLRLGDVDEPVDKVLIFHLDGILL